MKARYKGDFLRKWQKPGNTQAILLRAREDSHQLQGVPGGIVVEEVEQKMPFYANKTWEYLHKRKM